MKYLFILIITISTTICNSQNAAYVAIYEAAKKDFSSGIKKVDSLLKQGNNKFQPSVWTLRALIYYEGFRATDKQKFNSSLRDSVISSIKISASLYPDSTDNTTNKKLLKTIWAGYFNIAKSLLMDSLNYERSLAAYNKFKEFYLLYDPSTDFKAKDTEYFLSAGVVFTENYIKSKQLKDFEYAHTALTNVLKINASHFNANYNLGSLYYIKAKQEKLLLSKINDVNQKERGEKNILLLQNQALHFLVKAYDNTNVKALPMLYEICISMGDTKKAEEYKALGESKGVKFKQAE